jgi:hypothetical protein
MKRRSEDVATRRPLRRFERRAGRRWTPESLPSFRAPFPVADAIFSVACGAISFRPDGGSRLKSDSLEYLALLPTDARRGGNNLVSNVTNRTCVFGLRSWRFGEAPRGLPLSDRARDYDRRLRETRLIFAGALRFDLVSTSAAMRA